MNVHHILIDDLNPEHRELSICRSGAINRIRLEDTDYRVYAALEIDAHDYAALFHYRVIEACNALTFLSESANGLDSWDEAFLHRSNLARLAAILSDAAGKIDRQKSETIVLGWQDQPVAVAYLRRIDPLKTLEFLEKLLSFVRESEKEGCDLEFIL
ncbi:MAG: hypothetical protein HGB27_08215 [Chlorobiaceae bacterium]|nr:hypothetical protein [Chlorobiaceae bacterium]